MINVILVHGTWAKNATWSNSTDSALRTAICGELEGFTVCFHPINWSGTNSHQDRVRLGETINKKLADLYAEAVAPCFVLGHSHGGTGMQHAIRLDPLMAKRVSGWIFLATPFIQLKRTLSVVMERVIGALGTLGVFFILYLALLWLFAFFNRLPFLKGQEGLGAYASLLLASAMAYMIVMRGPAIGWVAWFRAQWSFVMICSLAMFAFELVAVVQNRLDWAPILKKLPIVFAAIALFVGCLMYGVSHNAFQDFLDGTRLHDALQRYEAEFDATAMTGCKCVFVRSNRDEASAGLSALHVLNRIIRSCVATVYRSLDWLSRLFDFGALIRRGQKNVGNSRPKHTPSWIATATISVVLLPAIVIVIVLVAYLLVWLVGFGLFGRDDRWLDLSTEVEWFANQLPGSAVSVKLLRALLSGAVILIGFAGIVTVMAAILLSVLGRSFGHWFVWTSLFLEMSVEPVPPGQWTVIQEMSIESREDPTQVFSLAHSSVYSNPTTLSKIARWIRGCLD